jgi:drug/metabolite transporter (DMT)-like permease
MPQQPKSKAYFALFLTSIIWGTTWVVSKIGFNGIHPIFFAAIRQLIAGALFLLFFAVRKKAVWPKPKEWLYLVLMAILLFAISNAFTIWGIRYINSGLGAIIGALFPIFVTLINWLIGSKNNPNLTATTGLILGLAGLVFIFYEHLSDFSNAGFGFGILLSVSACISWAIGTIITTRNIISLNRYYALGWQMFIGGIILNIVCYSSGLTIPISNISLATWLCILYMVIFASVIAFVSFLYTLQHLPTPVASIYAYVNPVVAVLLGHFVLGESWSISLLFGAFVTLIGVYLVNKGFGKTLREAESPEP